MYVYVASSWRNPHHKKVVDVLRAEGIDHYDFKDDEGFHWSDVGMPRPCTLQEYRKFCEESLVAQAAFLRDYDALRRATHTVLVMPAGRSAHAELGVAIGMQQETAVMFDLSRIADEPDLMHMMADERWCTITDMLDWLDRTGVSG